MGNISSKKDNFLFFAFFSTPNPDTETTGPAQEENN